MQHAILDSAGNTVASFDDALAARASLHAMVAVEPEAAEHLALLTYDDDGIPVGEALTVFDVQPGVEFEPSFFIQDQVTKAGEGVPTRAQTWNFGSLVPDWGPVVSDPTPQRA